MRLARIELIRFGSFADVALDFKRQPGLHLVYGPNEAGKSTALRNSGRHAARMIGIDRAAVETQGTK